MANENDIINEINQDIINQLISSNEEYNQLLQERLELEKEFNKQLKEEKNLFDNSVNFRKKMIVSLEKEKKLYEEQIKELREIGDVTDDEIKALEKRNQLIIDRIEEEEKVLELLDKQAKITEKYNKHIVGNNSLINRLTGATGRYKEGIDKFGLAIGKSLTLSDKFANSQKGLAFRTALADNNLNKALGSLGNYGLFLGLVGAGLAAFIENSIKLNGELDRQITRTNRLLGVSGEYNDELVDLGRNYLGYGITLERSGEIYKDLGQNVRDFRLANQEGRQEMALFVGQMENFGVTSNVSSGLLQELTRTFHITTNAALMSENEIIAFAREASLAPYKVASSLAANIPRIAQFGNRATSVFKEMELAGNNLGISTSQMFDIVGKFETFESASLAAAKFNALLGGGMINSTELLTKSLENPIEAIKYLREGFQNARKDIKDLNPAEIKALASALNMSQQDFVKLMGASNEEFKRRENSLKAQQLTQEQINKAAIKAQTIHQKINILQSQFAIAIEPLVDLTSNVLSWFTGIDAFKSPEEYAKEKDKKTKQSTNVGYARSTSLIAGVTTGAAIGTAIAPGIGTVIGGGIGGLVGTGVGAAFAKGTDNSPNGVSLVGEKGPELVSLPPKSSVINNKNTKSLMNLMSNSKSNINTKEQVKERQPIILQLDGKTIAETVADIYHEQTQLNRGY